MSPERSAGCPGFIRFTYLHQITIKNAEPTRLWYNAPVITISSTPLMLPLRCVGIGRDGGVQSAVVRRLKHDTDAHKI